MSKSKVPHIKDLRQGQTVWVVRGITWVKFRHPLEVKRQMRIEQMLVQGRVRKCQFGYAFVPTSCRPLFVRDYNLRGIDGHEPYNMQGCFTSRKQAQKYGDRIMNEQYTVEEQRLVDLIQGNGPRDRTGVLMGC